MNASCSRAIIGFIMNPSQKKNCAPAMIFTNLNKYRNNIFNIGPFSQHKFNLFEPKLEFYGPWEIANCQGINGSSRNMNQEIHGKVMTYEAIFLCVVLGTLTT